jgi:hypothetical protein
MHPGDPRVVFVRFVTPAVRVMRPADAPPVRSSSIIKTAQRARLSEPRRLPPGTMWYRYRSEITPDTASSRLFGYDAPTLAGAFPPGAEPPDGEELQDAYDEWMDNLHRGRYGGGKLGGAPSWDQADATPRCDAHGEMAHLLEYEGGQFLDGALHVFLCRACPAPGMGRRRARATNAGRRLRGGSAAAAALRRAGALGERLEELLEHDGKGRVVFCLGLDLVVDFADLLPRLRVEEQVRLLKDLFYHVDVEEKLIDQIGALARGAQRVGRDAGGQRELVPGLLGRVGGLVSARTL